MTEKPRPRYGIYLLMSCVIAASSAPPPAFAITPLSPSFCAAISDAVARLACFDRMFPASRPQSASKVTEACIDQLKQTLKAPSTFQLAEATVEPVKLSIDEYKDRELIRIRDSYDADTASLHRALMLNRIQYLRTKTDAVTVFDISIAYDAQNAFGAMLRGKAKCSVASISDNEDDVFADSLSVENR